MKLTNTTHLDTAFLRRLVSWAAKEIDLPTRLIRQVAFKRWRYHRGTAYRSM